MSRTAILYVTLGLTLSACGDDDAATDAGGADAGSPGVDAGPGETDAGPPDGVDAGPPGGRDAGEPDAGPAALPPGADTDLPFPIDRGDDGPETPGTYRGLALRLVDNGEPVVEAVDGRIGAVCIGMSNATQECRDFMMRVRRDLADEVSDQVVFVDCAVGSHALERWLDPADDAALWDACIEEKIPAAGLRADQVRVVYHKAAHQYASGDVFYPDPASDYFDFIDSLDAFATRVAVELPSVQAVYTTSRSYGGFTDRPSRGEPLSFEEGLALNAWLADHGRVDGVWHGWGPYIWAPPCDSGETNGSGVCYERADYQDDGVHPAAGARAKISAMIHARFRQHAWYRP